MGIIINFAKLTGKMFKIIFFDGLKSARSCCFTKERAYKIPNRIDKIILKIMLDLFNALTFPIL